MRKAVLALVAAALFGMTANYSMANEERSRSMGGSTGGSTESGTTRDSMDSSTPQSRDYATGGETGEVVKGWSAKKSIIGKTVNNEANEKIGKVEDVIISPDDSVSKAIIGVGGFLGMGEHHVAVPFKQLKMQDKGFVMSGATKDELKRMPKFEYKKQK